MEKLLKSNQETVCYSSQNVTDRIRFMWGRLSDDEIGQYGTDHKKFCDTVKTKYGLTIREIEKYIGMWERELHAAA